MELQDLPNPFTPMAFLPPPLAAQYEIQRYMLSITLGAYAWDLMRNLENDYYLLFKLKRGITTIVYYISRISTLTFLICAITFDSVTLQDLGCVNLIIITCIFWIISGSSTSLLFFLRLRPVFMGKKYAARFFIALWFLVLGSYSLILVRVKAESVSPGGSCIVVSISGTSAASVIIPPLYDTVVFAAVAHRILKGYINHEDDTAKGMIRAFFKPNRSFLMSRTVLRESQLYYFSMIGGSITSIVLYFVSTSLSEHILALAVLTVFKNAMACVVFRHIKFAANGISSDSRLLYNEQEAENGLRDLSFI